MTKGVAGEEGIEKNMLGENLMLISSKLCAYYKEVAHPDPRYIDLYHPYQL